MCQSLGVITPHIKEILMLKTGIAGLAAIFVTASLTCSQAATATTAGQEEQRGRLSSADLNALTDARIGIVKAALQLTPEQTKYWPALEEAIRNRAAGRQNRVGALMRLREEKDIDPIELVRHRADALAQRSAELKQLAAAWQPLYSSLSSDQKQRLETLAVHILRILPTALQEAAEFRRMQDEESDEDRAG
jgi:hypothetical protein